MSFFIHDHLISAIRYLYPELSHGQDFMVLMGIEQDGTPVSDAWIERWPAGLPVPGLQELKDAYQAALLEPPPPPPPVTSVLPRVFMARFTPEERLAIYSAATQSPLVLMLVTDLAAASEIVFADPDLSAGMDALVAAGLITQARSEEILPLAVRTTGMEQV